ncbi:Oidioi.mRNA.OKI2018_I69.XSR.g14367.t1.cds [Oikopleura dioica]|uniref:Oidioi.mRNA.OKI2018_I69.XSR.g14367.t1.cds n=1 Tax=Oikopleura dioica TaxID=34765 RepID=A0ABN7SEU2_OIKDI|nr:Oidioi.mRNA.OKI2018_I69.XSR.g14367.t1.cds [Oikopleura dioica]
MDYAPKIHGHPSIRRRIKNALQPQLDQFKRELRALKSESEYRNSQPSKGGETDSTDFRTRLQQLELRIAPLEAEQNNIIVEDVRTALTKLVNDIDGRFEEIVADIPSAPIELDVLELERVNDRIDSLNSSLISMNQKTPKEEKALEAEQVEEIELVTKTYASSSEIEQLESKWTANLRFLAGQFTNLTDSLAADLNYVRMMILMNPPQDVQEEVEGRLTDIDEKLKMLTEKVENNESQLPKEKDSQSEIADELGPSMENITAMARENLLLINLNAMSIEDQKGIIQEHNVAIAKLIDSFTLAGEQLRELSSNATERSMKSNLRITVVEQAMSGTAKQISDLTKEFEKQEKEILASKNGLNNSTSMIETLSESIRNYELLSSSIQKRFNKTQKTIERLVNKQPVVVPQVDQLELTNLSQKFNSLDNHVDEIKKMMKTDHDIVNVLTSNFAQLKKNLTESNSMKDQSFDLQLNGVMDKMREAFSPRIDSCEEQQIILGERLDEVERSRPAESTISKKFNELIKITDEISRTNEEIIQRVDDSERRSSNVEDELKTYLAKEIDVKSRSFEENLNSTRSHLEADISEVRHEMMDKARESDLSALSIKADGIESELEAFRTQLISRRNDISKISSAVQEAKTQTETITFLTDDLASRASKYEHASELLKSSLIDIERKIDDGIASSEDSIEIMSERIDELEKTASTTANLSAKVADIKEEQDKLEGQLIDMSFLIEDDLTTFNNSINVMKTQMSHSLSSKIQYLKESLSGEMSTKMNILSENLRKVNTTSMTASELRSLLETKILQQQVGQKNLEDKLAVIEDHVARVNSRQTTDYESLKTSVSNLDSKLLDASNRAEQALSIVSQKTAEITEKLEMNKELYDRHQESIDRMSSKSVKFEDYLRERKSVVTQIESSLVTLKSDVSGLIDSHAMERKQMMQQRQIIMKLTDNYEDLRIELTELDDDLRPQSEQLFKSIRSVESRVLNLATNVTQVDRTHQNSMNIISGRVAQLQEQINSNMEQTLRGQTDNSEYVDKKFGQLLHKVDRQGQRLAASEGKSLEHAKELGFLASDIKKIQEDSTSTLALVFKLANKSNEIEKLTKVNSDELEKRTQILHDKLIVPINHQAGKHSALEQLLVAEIEKIELSVQSILRGEALLNSTVTALGERTRNNEAIFSNSMEANRNFHMSINSRITSIENDFLNLPEKIEDIEDKITQIREENHKIENEVDANSAQTIQNKEIISEITSSVRNWEKATASIGQEIDLVKNEKDKQEKELVETLDKIKEDILMLGIQAKQNEDALKLVDGNVSKNSSIIIDENKQIIQQIAYLTEDMDVFHERLQQLEGVWSTSFETLATQLVASLDDSSDNMSSDSTYDSYTVLDDQDYLDELSIRGDPPTYRRRKRRESPPNNTRKLLDQIHKIAGVFRKYKQTNQAMQQRISSIEDDILNMHNDLGKLQKSVQYTEGKLLENHKQLKLNLENYSKNAASIVEFGHKIEDVKAAQNSQSLKLKTVDNNKDKIYSLEVAIGEQTANFNRRFLEVSESQANLMRKFETSTENFLTNIFTIESSVKYLNETYSRETTWVKERVDKLKKAVDESDQNVDLKLSILENRIKPEILEWKTKHFEILKRLDGDVTAIQKKAGENRKLFDDIIEDYTSIARA